MAKLLKLRRGTTTEHNSFTGAAGEVTVNTTTNGLVVHDGTTQGGHPSLGANSPALTGTPTAPTAGSGTNTTQIATTAFVTAALPDITGKANIASPTFTGTPAAPTAAADTNTTQIATTAYVQTELGDYAPLAGASFSGVVTAQKAAIAEIDAISDASTITLDLATSTNFNITTDASTARTLGNPSNCVAGQTGTIFVTGAGFSGYGSYWKFPGGTGPTYTATSGKADVLDYRVLDSTHILVVGTTNYDVS